MAEIPEDNNDEGIFMKMHHNTESVTSLYAPVPMTPTQTSAKGFFPSQSRTSPAAQTPDSPNFESGSSRLKVQDQMKRITSTGNMQGNEPEAKVLVLYTGGTIGMLRNEKNGELFFEIYHTLIKYVTVSKTGCVK
jgi:hypothetical protein